jgi:hypothetical protein
MWIDPVVRLGTEDGKYRVMYGGQVTCLVLKTEERSGNACMNLSSISFHNKMEKDGLPRLP